MHCCYFCFCFISTQFLEFESVHMLFIDDSFFVMWHLFAIGRNHYLRAVSICHCEKPFLSKPIFFIKKNVFSLSKIAQRNGFQFLMLVCTCVTMSHKMFGVSQFKKSFADCLSKCRPPMPCSIRLVSYACSSFFIFMIHLNFSIISSLLFSRCGYVQCKTGLQSFSSYTTHKHS